MERYLICSDIHGRDDLLRAVIKKESSIKAIFIAGDLELDTYEVNDIIASNSPSTDVFMVSGNCDSYSGSASLLPGKLTTEFKGRKIFMTHGHRYRNADKVTMSYAAMEEGCDIVIYGHTHIAEDLSLYGIRFINPGALKNGSYAIMSITDEENILIKQKDLMR